jgi:hypothetical protein
LSLPPSPPLFILHIFSCIIKKEAYSQLLPVMMGLDLSSHFEKNISQIMYNYWKIGPQESDKKKGKK